MMGGRNLQNRFVSLRHFIDHKIRFLVSSTMSAKKETVITTAYPDSAKMFPMRSDFMSSVRGSRIVSVPESIVHRETPAIRCNDVVENPAISSRLVREVSKKAFALCIPLADKLRDLEYRTGQCGFIRYSLPTVADYPPPTRKKQKIMDKHGSVVSSAMKLPSSAARISCIPVTALHNDVKESFQGELHHVICPPIDANVDGDMK